MNTKETNSFLITESPGKLMRRYAIPCVISLLVAALYNIVDQIFIANATYLGSYGNAANTVVFPLTVVALSIATMLGDGCCAFVSISLGAKEKERAGRGIGNTIIWVAISGIALMLIYLLFQEPILTAFGATVNAETFRLSKEYFFWISLGIPFYMFGQAMNPVIRSDGSPSFAMATLLVGAGFNIIFDPICIYILKWGMMGAAVATIGGQILAALMSLYYMTKMKAAKINKSVFKPDARLMKKILPLGMTSFLSQISIVLSMAAVLNMVTKYGAMDPVFGLEEYSHIPTAVVGIVMKFFQIVISVSIGLAAGCIPIVGYNIGAAREDRVYALMKRLLSAEVIVGAVASVLFLLFPYQFALVFGSGNESTYYTEFAVTTIRVFLCLLPLSCLNKGTFIFLQSLGKAKESTLLSLMREILFGVGLPLLLPVFFGLYGILFFMPAADVLTFIAALIVIAATRTELLKRMSPQGETSAAENADEEKQSISQNNIGSPLTDKIITIGRSYGSGGRTIGKRVAEYFNIPYYDSEILEEVAKATGLSKKYFENFDERSQAPAYIYRSVGFGTEGFSDLSEIAREAQREIIENIAAKGPCVIVGRRSDQILKNQYKDKLLTVFISASKEFRIKHISQRENLSEKEAEKKIKKADKERTAYYSQDSDAVWGDAANYDLCFRTDILGIEKTAEALCETIKHSDNR